MTWLQRKWEETFLLRILVMISIGPILAISLLKEYFPPQPEEPIKVEMTVVCKESSLLKVDDK